MDYADKYIMRQGIASALDHPSVYMGGPSMQARRKAERIIALLLADYDITPKERPQNDAVTARTWLSPDHEDIRNLTKLG